MIFSLNNRLVLEEYVKEGLKSKVMGGIATPGQRDGIKKLKVLVSTRLADGRDIPAGSYAYLREEALFSQAWSAKLFTCDSVPGKFMLVGLEWVEFIETTENNGRSDPLPISGFAMDLAGSYSKS